jgi:hypothetical protein
LTITWTTERRKIRELIPWPRNPRQIKDLRATLAELKQTNKILAWLGGLVGSAFVLWVVGFFLGLIH